MGVELELARLQNHARRDQKLKAELIATKKSSDPYKAFCDKAAEYGYDIPLFELADMGQSFCDAMLRSQNGGGSYSFGEWADFYGMFFDALEY